MRLRHTEGAAVEKRDGLVSDPHLQLVPIFLSKEQYSSHSAVSLPFLLLPDVFYDRG